MNKRWSTGLVFVGILLAAPAMSAGSRYVVTRVTTNDLGTFGGSRSEATDINATGNIVGWADIPGNIPHAFLLQGASMHDLGYALPTGASVASGINDSNVIVGRHIPGGAAGEEYHAFQWVAGAVTFLNDTHPTPGIRANSSAVAVANSGVIAGHRSWFDCNNARSTVWPNSINFITLLEGPTCWGNHATDINSQSMVIGYNSDTNTGLWWRFSFFWFTRGVVPLPASSPGYPFASALPKGLNNAGFVVGEYTSDGARRAFVWDGAAANSRDLGVIPTGTFTSATDINNGNFIVGYGNRLGRASPVDPEFQQTVAFLYSESLGLYPLPRAANMAVNAECRANALNERRSSGLIEVVGYCDTLSGRRAYRWNVTVAILPPS